jgi:hypothetical protein
MKFLKHAYFLLLFSATPLMATGQTIPIAHLELSALTDGFKKSFEVELKGYLVDQSGAKQRTAMVMKTSHGVPVEFDGKSYIKVDATSVSTIQDMTETVTLSSYVDPKTMSYFLIGNPDGEVTIYTYTRNYPATMKVGQRLVISRTEERQNGMKSPVVAKELEVLSLEKVQGEENLYQLCEVAYEYKKSSNFKKVNSENSSCFLVDGVGQIKGYATLLVQAKTKMVLTGSVKIIQ